MSDERIAQLFTVALGLGLSLWVPLISALERMVHNLKLGMRMRRDKRSSTTL